MSNTGPGVAEAELARLFEPFQRLGRSRGGESDGHFGLGLSIVHAIAAAHRATLTARPRPDGGLCVAVGFPSCDPATTIAPMDRGERDAYLDRVLIGGRERRSIVLEDYDETWPVRFERERGRVRAALGNLAVRIEHVGSTSVPGLAAKPIIDVLVTVEDPDDESVLVPTLTAAGYELRVREPGHRMFRTPERDVHVHVWRDSDPEVGRCLRFRARLRRSPADREAYEQLKRSLAAREWADMNDYANAKGPLIEEILARAAE